MPGHTTSYYAATRNNTSVRASLHGDITADACIIGAGFTGISAALTLAERGYKPVVLEGELVGFGASGRNGGQMINGYSRELDELQRRYGRDEAQGLAAMAMEGADIIRERVAKYQIKCDLVPGAVMTAFSRRQMRGLEHTRKVWAEFGHQEFEMIDREGLRGIVASDRYAGGLLDRKGGHIHPLNLVQGEAEAAESLGAVIYENSRVIAVERGDTVTVRTNRGSVRAKHVLVCGNAYIGDLLRRDIGSKMMAVSSQVLTTEILDPDFCASLLPANYCIEDSNYFLDYFRRTADNRMLYGGGTVYGGSDPASIEGKLRPLMEKTFPQLKGRKIEFSWSGNFALTVPRVPHVGRIGGNILFSHGDSGHGVTTTHLLGRLLGEAITNQIERFDVFAKLPYFPFPGGKNFRIPLTVLGSWYYRLLDRLG